MATLETARRCFKQALEVTVDENGVAAITAEWPECKRRSVVYAAIRSDGQALKVGITGGRLIDRWRGIVATINGKRRRPNELQDRQRWLDAAKGFSFQVWCKEASELIIRLEGESARTVLSPYAEEAYWDSVFKPLIGMSLSERKAEPRASNMTK